MTEQYVSDAHVHVNCEHELKDGEIHVGNTDVRNGLSIPDYLIGKMRTARLGEQAYSINGEPIERDYMRPLIIHESESMKYDSIMMARLREARR